MATDKRFVVKNGLQTENINFVYNDAVVGSSNITATMLSSNVLSFSGTSGQLFSIADTMTGVIFSVNDISGVPSIEVYDDGRIRMAESFGNVIIGNSTINTSRTSTSTTTGILQVAGGAGIVGNLNVGGTKNLFTGNVGIGTSTVTGANSNVLTVYGTAMTYGNVVITNTAAGGSGIYFPDGTYQTTAASSGASSAGVAGTVQYSGGSGTFAGDATNFFWDSTNKRLGIGSSAPTNTLTVWGSTPAWFNTTNGSNIFEILVGNATTTSATLGYASTVLNPYSYIRNVGGTVGVSVLNSGSVGIRGITNPQNALDVGGALAVGNSYAGVRTAPTNGQIVQGSVGIGTFTVASTLDVWGIGSFTSAISAGGSASVNSLISNNNIFGSTLNTSGAAQLASLIVNANSTTSTLNVQNTATVNALTSNGAISGTTITGTAGTFTSLQNSGMTTTNVLVSNVYGLFGQNVTINSNNASTLSTDGALVVSGGVGIGGRLNVGGNSYYAGILNTASNLIAQSINSNTNVVGVNLQSTGLTSVASLTVNTGTYTNTLNVNSTANVNALTSNTGITVSAGGVTVSGLSTFTGNVNVSGNLNVTGTINTQNANVLVVNDPIIYLGEGNTSNLWDLGIIGNYNDGVYEHTGLVRNRNDGIWTLFDNMTSEPNISTGNINWNDSTLTFAPMKLGNLTVAGNTRSTSSTTGAVILSGVGGMGIGGNLYVGGQQSGISGNLWIAGSNTSTSSTTGALVVTNGIGVGGNVYAAGNVVAASFQPTSASVPPNGLYLSAANTLSLAASAAEQVRISSTDVTLTATNPILSFFPSDNTYSLRRNSTTMTLDSSGLTSVASASGTSMTTRNGAITLATGAGAGTTTRVTIDSTGNVGIGSAMSVIGSVFIRDLTVNSSIQSSGTSTVNALVSNVYGLFGQNVTINSTNASTSTTTGALIVAGGIGLAGNVTAGGNIVVAGTVQAGFLNVGNSVIATSITSNSTMQSAGTATVNALVSNIFGRFGQNVTVGSTNAATSTSTGALVVSGGIGAAGNVVIGGNLIVPLASSLSFVIASNSMVGSSITSNSTMQSADTATVNALVSNVYGRFGQNVTIGSTNTSVSTTTGALVVSGGIGLAGNINVGGTRSLFTGSVGIGTSTATGTNANVFSLYGTGMVYGNLVLGNTAAGISGIYFADGTYQTTANTGGTGGGPGNYGNANVASYLTGPVQIGNLYVVNSTVSTNTITGAVIVNGGVGIGGNLNVGGTNNLFTGNVGIGTTSTTSNAASIYNSVDISGNIDLTGISGRSSGIYFADGTYQTTAVTNQSMATYEYTADGATTAFSTAPSVANGIANTVVFVNGVYQPKDGYTWSGNVLTFDAPPVEFSHVSINVIGSVAAYGTSSVIGYSTVSGNTTLSPTAPFAIVSGNVTVTLPSATVLGGQMFYVKNIGTGNVVVATINNQTIDGSNTLIIDSQWSTAGLLSDGANWFIF